MERILLVDDEPNVLEAMGRHLRRTYEVAAATSGWEGLEIAAAQGPFAVALSDMRMPGMDGVEFLATLKTRAPDTVRMMLTGNADLQVAVDAVNQGHVFRFLTKPCPPEVLMRAIADGVTQHQLLNAERELLEKTLRSAVKVLTEMLSLANPAAFGRSQRIAGYVRYLLQRINLGQAWQVELAAMLSQVGAVIFPPDILSKMYAGAKLTSNEQKMWDSYPSVGRNLLEDIPRLGMVSRMIEGQKFAYVPVKPNQSWADEDIEELGGHLLRVAAAFDDLVMQGHTPAEAVEAMLGRPEDFNSTLVKLLGHVAEFQGEPTPRRVGVKELTPNMRSEQDILSEDGVLLAGKGEMLTAPLIQRLRVAARSIGVQEPIAVTEWRGW